jgi:hypothetical membrane protein
MKSPFWQKHVHRLVFIGCGLFVLLTVAAMFAYPGGTFTSETTEGYDFFRNFFSDLGRVTAPNGEPNTVSLIFFFTALTLAGIGLVLFFIAFRSFFMNDGTGTLLSLLGTVIGIASGLCFVGIALAPYDLFFEIHYQLVFWAFRTFLIAVAVYSLVIFRQNTYPRHYGWIFVAFTVFLAGYILLLEFGPEATTPTGLVIQAMGQKVIVYVSILSVMAQSWAAYQIRQS